MSVPNTAPSSSRPAVAIPLVMFILLTILEKVKIKSALGCEAPSCKESIHLLSIFWPLAVCIFLIFAPIFGVINLLKKLSGS